jgi:hypothetical protein
MGRLFSGLIGLLSVTLFLGLVLALGLFGIAQLADGPPVDFSKEGLSCVSDDDCLPEPQFQGVSAKCFEGTCVWQKYLMNSEVYSIQALVVAVYLVAPLGLTLALVLFGRWLWRRRSSDPDRGGSG